jgi:hypothetical protein
LDCSISAIFFCRFLQLFFSCDCIEDVAELFKVDEPCNVVAGRVGVGMKLAVLAGAGDNVVGEANVEVPGAAGEDVDVEEVFPLLYSRKNS